MKKHNAYLVCFRFAMNVYLKSLIELRNGVQTLPALYVCIPFSNYMSKYFAIYDLINLSLSDIGIILTALLRTRTIIQLCLRSELL